MIPTVNNIDLKNFTTFGISSIARQLIQVKTYSELLKTLQFCYQHKKNFLVLGEGSNIIPPDEGVEKLVIINSSGVVQEEDSSLIAGSGVPLSEVVKFAIRNALGGIESLSGIPGTIGGAVIGNAGAYGKSISDSVEWVEIWDEGKIRVLRKDDCKFYYRESVFKHNHFVVLKVKLNMIHDDKDKLEGFAKEVITLRKEKYHDGIKCPGSFFKNILVSSLTDEVLKKIDLSKIKGSKVPAGYLLEEVDARGMKVGDIQVASFHGNLLINLGNGKCSEVIKLSTLLKEKVKQRFGIHLEEEVRYI